MQRTAEVDRTARHRRSLWYNVAAESIRVNSDGNRLVRNTAVECPVV